MYNSDRHQPQQFGYGMPIMPYHPPMPMPEGYVYTESREAEVEQVKPLSFHQYCRGVARFGLFSTGSFALTLVSRFFPAFIPVFVGVMAIAVVVALVMASLSRKTSTRITVILISVCVLVGVGIGIWDLVYALLFTATSKFYKAGLVAGMAIALIWITRYFNALIEKSED